MAEDVVLRITLSIIIATLAAIVYSLRVLVLMDRRIAKIEEHLDKVVHRTLEEEYRIEKSLKKKR